MIGAISARDLLWGGVGVPNTHSTVRHDIARIAFIIIEFRVKKSHLTEN